MTEPSLIKPSFPASVPPTVLLGLKLKKVEDLFCRLNKILNLAKGYGKTKVTLLRSKLDIALSLRSQLSELEEEVHYLNTQVEKRDQIDISKKSNAFDDIIEAIDVLYSESVEICNKPIPTTGSTSAQFQKPSTLKLPTIEIKPFDNTLIDFPRFLKLFEAIYDTNASLSNCEKFYYLQAYLQGEALALVNTFPLTDQGYENAFAALKNRYNSPRALAAALTHELFNFIPAKKANADSLCHFLKVHHDYVTTLKSIPDIQDLSEFLLLTIAARNLDPLTRRLFESKMADKDRIPSYQDLIIFVNKQLSTIELLSVENNSQVAEPVRHYVKKNISYPNLNVQKVNNTPYKATVRSAKLKPNNFQAFFCIYCSDKTHNIGRCPQFLNCSLQERLDWLSNSSRCKLCLSSKHNASQCTSKKCCYYCQSKQHNSLLCSQKVNQNSESATAATEKVLSCISKAGQTLPANLMCTNIFLGSFQAHVAIVNKDNCLRCVLDTGASRNIITLTAARTLGLRISSEKSTLSGLGEKIVHSLGTVTLNLISRFNPDFTLKIEACVLQKITSDLQPVPNDANLIKVLSNFNLADSGLLINQPASVDLLLGVTATTTLLAASKAPLPLNSLMPACTNLIYSNLFLLPSPMGHIILGEISTNSSENETSDNDICLTCSDCNTAVSDIKHFFQTENIDDNLDQPVLNELEIYAESHFSETHSRDQSGTFVVRLPFLSNPPILQSNRNKALSCFISMERKLLNNLTSYFSYQSALQQFLDKKEIVVSSIQNHYILSQHTIVKKSNKKVKIVFNPAIKSPVHSLNDQLICGQKLQKDLNHVLLAGRSEVVAVACDIDNFYRSIRLHQEDAERLHIFARLKDGRVSPDGCISECSIQHLCYGLTSAPFIALRCVNQLCDENKIKFPEAANILRNSRYIDDVFYSSPDVGTALKRKSELIEILNQGNFTLGKFVSSHSSELGLASNIVMLSACNTAPVLGCLWDPVSDVFKFEIKAFSGPVTRRTCTSYLAKCFDSQGLLSPVLFFLKRFVQLLWHNHPHTGWDKPLSSESTAQWMDFTKQMPILSNLCVPRYCSLPNAINYLCVFSDASNSGFSSSAYVLSKVKDKKPISNLIYAKTKLAPLRTVRTIPQLELAGIELSAKVVKYLLSGNLPFNFQSVFCFSDSMIALAYLNIPPSKLKVYVANRVSNIKNLTKDANVTWLYCNTQQNPSDLSCRGIQPSKIINNSLWFNGPEFITNDFPPTINEPLASPVNLPDVKNEILVSTEPESNIFFYLTERYSSFSKLQKVVCYVLKFIGNCRYPGNRSKRPINSSEIKASIQIIVKSIQLHFFKNILLQLKNNKQLPNLPKEIIKLQPFLDSDGILRVGGRLENSQLSYDAKHPILLPKKCNLSRVLCRYYHILTAHGGSNLSIGLLRSFYWVISGKAVMRSIIHSCTTCARWHPSKPSPVQGDLPYFRVQNTFPFRSVVGMDCFGPYLYKLTNRKNSASAKVWGLIFVCESTRASHIEPLTSLSSRDFLAAIDRFTARRGIPSTFRADCGTNFTAGFKKMTELSKFLKENENDIISSLATKTITFQHLPAYTPWMGSWEQIIRCCKRLLNCLLTKPLYFEEFCTVFSRVEALLNSRPYFEPGQDANDNIELLCPASFLVGGPFYTPPTILPYSDSDSKNRTLNSRWDRLNQIIRIFWKRWHTEVLHTLMQKQKWPKARSANLSVGQLVWVPDTRSTPGTWPLGRIQKLYPDNKNVVRVVDVKTAGGVIRRSARNLVLLPQ